MNMESTIAGSINALIKSCFFLHLSRLLNSLFYFSQTYSLKNGITNWSLKLSWINITNKFELGCDMSDIWKCELIALNIYGYVLIITHVTRTHFNLNNQLALPPCVHYTVTCACPKPRPRFPTKFVVFFFTFKSFIKFIIPFFTNIQP
jgi:hypothetical protein